MKKTIKLLLLAFIATGFIFSSCDRTTEEEVVEFDVLKTYMVDNGMDLDKVITNAESQKFVMFPADGDLSAKYIMDIRANDAFTAGHIAGAHNVAFADILTEAATADKPIVVVCYTGQTACYATALLRLAGHSDVQALKWGMSGWNAANAGPWNGAITGNPAEGNANWNTQAAPLNGTFLTPELNTGYETGSDILMARVEAVIADGFKGVDAADVVNTPTDYFINNYFSETDYLGFGHIAGAYRINPLLLGDDSFLGLDPTKSVVTYCYTGQTSAVVTAFLRVMGYDAYSLKFGMNGLYNNNAAWTSNKWSDAVPADFTVVTE